MSSRRAQKDAKKAENKARELKKQEFLKLQMEAQAKKIAENPTSVEIKKVK